MTTFSFSNRRVGQRIAGMAIGMLVSQTLVFSQAPGGVKEGLTSWFKANGQVTTTGPVNHVLAWTSELENIRLTSSAIGRRPFLQPTNTPMGNFNFNPFIQFVSELGTNLGRPATVPDLLGSAGTIFLITNMAEDSRNEHTAFTYRSTSDYRYQIKPGWRIQVGEKGMGWTQDLSKEFMPFTAPLHSAFILISRGNGAGFRGRKNADSIPLTNANDKDFNPAVVPGVYVGCNNSTGTEPFNGGIAEVITYNNSLTDADVNKVESYLALKYGVTLCQQPAFEKQPSNYTASNGTVFWQAAVNKGFGNCITGIGRDDGAALLQKQSFSVHNNALIYLYNDSAAGVFSAANAENKSAITANASFVMIGDNGLGNELTTCVPGGIYKRMARIWKVQKTGTGINKVSIAVEKSAVPAGVTGVLVSASAAFPAGKVTYYPLIASGTRLCATLPFNNKDHFTLVASGKCE